MSKGFSHICRKVVAVGRNYVEHARELGSQIESDPVIFLKPPSAIIEQGEKIVLPEGITDLHHEVELGLVIGKELSKAKLSDFRDSLLGFVVAMDMTNRALQNQLKSRQLPWTLSKSFDTSCPVGPLLPCAMLPPKLFVSDYEEFRKNASTVELWLRVNGTDHQRATIDGMIHSPAKLISFISHHMRLEPGDLILTGTPAGVGPVKSGDVITAGIKGLCEVEFRVV
ncbi:hypothetical protein CRM22_011320 [Opisthorchis felineus]|uniref:oxaloacetate tautomerase n=1 Tax=Opisthorchis felineus TaxID=147828 RepID=A0A4S2JNV5_OPIFE|nr:hypothetical protein CRM22_011320 [Opisthorchis felineus]TGZ37854.1 hypothetical protein CRM22_011320 [Opisthorchis felineus]